MVKTQSSVKYCLQRGRLKPVAAMPAKGLSKHGGKQKAT